ncbi:MAG: hypothetical protein WCR02_08625 [Sphaerochaetaceae bacterium]
MIKKTLCLICLLLVLIAFPLFADGNSSSLGSLSANTSFDGSFGFSLTPSLAFGKFSMMFNLLVKGTYTTNPFNVAFDFSNYMLPERENTDTDISYGLRIAKQYSKFIKSMHYGFRYDKFYFRYGKLTNITLGDGALLNNFYDNSVGYLESKPGFNLKVGPLGHYGFEFVVDDVFLPSLLGGRLYLLPFATDKPEQKRINRMEWAVSLLYDPQNAQLAGQVYKEYLETSFEIAQPMFSGEQGQTTFFVDYLMQGPKKNFTPSGNAIRIGLWGRTKTLLSFNLNVTAPISGTYYCDYFTTGYNDPKSKEYSTTESPVSYPMHLGTVRLDTTMGLNLDTDQIYAGIRLRSDLSGIGFANQRILATVRIDKLFMKFISLDLNYEKLYPANNQGVSEGFLAGIGSLRNVYISANSQIHIKGVMFNVELTANYDDEAKVNFLMDYSVEIALF